MQANHNDCWCTVPWDRVPVAGGRYTTMSKMLACNIKKKYFGLKSHWLTASEMKSYSLVGMDEVTPHL